MRTCLSGLQFFLIKISRDITIQAELGIISEDCQLADELTKLALH